MTRPKLIKRHKRKKFADNNGIVMGLVWGIGITGLVAFNVHWISALLIGIPVGFLAWLMFK